MVVGKRLVAISALVLAACASQVESGGTASAGVTPLAPPVFQKGEESQGMPFPHIGRATEGRLSVTKEGCVYVEAVENLLIIWPADTVYDERRRTFQTARSGELQFGMELTFTGTPVQPFKDGEVGGVEIPAACRRMLVLLVAPDGARTP